MWLGPTDIGRLVKPLGLCDLLSLPKDYRSQRDNGRSRAPRDDGETANGLSYAASSFNFAPPPVAPTIPFGNCALHFQVQQQKAYPSGVPPVSLQPQRNFEDRLLFSLLLQIQNYLYNCAAYSILPRPDINSGRTHYVPNCCILLDDVQFQYFTCTIIAYELAAISHTQIILLSFVLNNSAVCATLQIYSPVQGWDELGSWFPYIQWYDNQAFTICTNHKTSIQLESPQPR